MSFQEKGCSQLITNQSRILMPLLLRNINRIYKSQDTSWRVRFFVKAWVMIYLLTELLSMLWHVLTVQIKLEKVNTRDSNASQSHIILLNWKSGSGVD